MCSECFSTPCRMGCPNAPEPTVYSHCAMCGMEIYEGDEYYEVDGKDYCEECIGDCSKIAETEGSDEVSLFWL